METDARMTDAELHALETALVPLRHNAGWYAGQCARLVRAVRAERLAGVQATQQAECEQELMRLLTTRAANGHEDTDLFAMILSNLLQVRQRNAQISVANAHLERALAALLDFPHTPGCLQLTNDHYACSCPRRDVLRWVEEGLGSRVAPPVESAPERKIA